MAIDNLTSGLIGAVIGSVIGGAATYVAAIKGAKISIEETAKLDSKRRVRSEESLVDQVLNSLKEELEFNLKLTDRVQVSHAKVRFVDKAFEFARMNAYILPNGLISLLNPVYVEAARFNVLADYDQEKVPFGHGSLDGALIIQGEKIKEKIREIKPEFEGHLTSRVIREEV